MKNQVTKILAQYEGHIAPSAIYFKQAHHGIVTDHGNWFFYNEDVNHDGLVESVFEVEPVPEVGSVLDTGNLEYLIKTNGKEFYLEKFVVVNGKIIDLPNYMDK